MAHHKAQVTVGMGAFLVQFSFAYAKESQVVSVHLCSLFSRVVVLGHDYVACVLGDLMNSVLAHHFALIMSTFSQMLCCAEQGEPL